jgi:hypothetical protein
MPIAFETNTLTVGELFSGSNVFRMPIFQRPYSWEEEKALELFGDIHQAMEKGDSHHAGEYFLGPIIVASKGSLAPLEVVDGQQRLVTLSVIFAILRDLLPQGLLQRELQEGLRRPEQPGRGLPEQARVRLRQSDHDEFEEWVQRPGGTLALPGEANSDSTDRLLNAIKSIKDDIGRVNNAYVEELARFILNNCYLVRIQAQNLDDAYVLFRSLNSRGLPLNELDIIRAELVGANYDPELAQSIANCWDEIQSEIGHDEFLTYVRTVISLVRPEATESDLREIIRDVLRVPQDAVDFRRYLTAFLQSYVGLNSGTLQCGGNSAEINRILACLKKLPFDNWRTPALVWLAQSPNSRLTCEFFRALEALALGLFILGKTKLQIARRFKDITVEVLTGDATTTRGALFLTAAETVKLREILDAPISARKKYLRHLLLRLNTLILHPDLPPHFPDDATIEHVLPQKPNGKSRWVEMYPNAGGRKALCELLGNYALLTGKMNTSARNNDFADKKQIIFALANVSMFPLTGTLAAYETWTERDIRQRHAEMMRMLQQILPI